MNESAHVAIARLIRRWGKCLECGHWMRNHGVLGGTVSGCLDCECNNNNCEHANG